MNASHSSFGSEVRARAATLILLLCLGFASGSAGAQAAPAQRPIVDVVTVGRDSLKATQVWDGVLQPLREATLSAQAQGRIVALHVQAGDAVREGQVLAEIDAREYALAASRDRAQLGESQATLAEARAAHARSRELYEQGFISKAALDQAAAALQIAQARQRQAQAGAGLSNVASDHTLVRAPWNGVVTAVPVQVGDLASPGRALFELHAPDRLRAVAYLPNSRVAELASAPRARVELTQDVSGQQVESERIAVIPSSDPGSGTTEVRVELPAAMAAAAGWVPGRHVKLAFETPSARAALVVPASSLLVRGELVGVYVAADGGFLLRAVRPGRASGDRVEILSGLREGERIAVDAVRAGLRDALPGAAATGAAPTPAN